ncbi:YtzC family protein [Metabacillus sp. GX 13764]|uniref:YtzC family protein n=1 Tax=Metabacillus kandeliae TaxID=2900151 RepID=UPI001E6544CF|nr:YtzC family protein [Metabacillus kandeliae]MCD7032665.1 YtzC family protein [Metabacillus kandeliae]
MATRQSVTDHLNMCSETLSYAQGQYHNGRMQEHYNDTEYTKAQQMLEDAVNDSNKLSLSANDQQKEELYRMRLQLQELQNEMILQRH